MTMLELISEVENDSSVKISFFSDNVLKVGKSLKEQIIDNFEQDVKLYSENHELNHMIFLKRIR